MATFLADSSLIDPSEAAPYQQWLHQSNSSINDLEHTLTSIPKSTRPSYAPLATLCALLENFPSRWPVLQLQRTFMDLWKLLPEDAKAGHGSPVAQELLDHTLRRCKASYPSLLNLFDASSTSSAILDPETGRSASHAQVSATIRDFRLPLGLKQGTLKMPASLEKPCQLRTVAGHPKPVVGLSLPNGPLLGLAVLATATYYTVAPLAHGSGVGKDQFKADVLQSKCSLVVATASDVKRLGLLDPWLTESGISVFLAELSQSMGLVLNTLDGRRLDYQTLPCTVPNTADDTSLLLFTSGTSGTKKLVPVSIHSMVCGVAAVEASWGLTQSMRCLNQMPLNHVGGLIRNLFAPILSGGSVICCAAFDANLFWDCVEDYDPTWYYASPSMHQIILEAGAERPNSVAKSKIRLICNAAGGLLPSLAVQLREMFSTSETECIVLPSYGMTECMPISTPPLNYRLERPGTSGVSVGPEIAILDERHQPRMSTGTVGHIAVRGAAVFEGYLGSDNSIDKSCFTEDGWFDTGDVGWLDQQGYLYINGRSKEVINRGGELISPFEVEEAIIAAAADPDSPIYGRVRHALAFSVPHDVLQEVVGVAVASPEGFPRPCLQQIAKSVKSVLSQVKVPVLIVYMNGGVPTNNNKVLRIRLAERLGLSEICDNTPATERYFEAVCPAANTPLSQSIKCHPLSTSNQDQLKTACMEVISSDFEYHIRKTGFYPELMLAPKDDPKEGSTVTHADLDTQQILKSLKPKLHGYHTPVKVSYLKHSFPRDVHGEIDEIVLEKSLRESDPAPVQVDNCPSTEATVRRIFAQILSLPPNEVSSISDFFELGGDSMAAGRLLSALRKEYSFRLPISDLFTNPKVYQLAAIIDEKIPQTETQTQRVNSANDPYSETAEEEGLSGCSKTCSSSSVLLMLVQLMPIAIVYPLKRAMTWTIFIYMLTETQNWATNEGIFGRLLNLVISMSVGGIVTGIVAPLCAIAFKWLVIGRFREGMYPMWGMYHTRWWLVQKIVAIGGKGIFGWSNWSTILYLRLLGARIGKGVTIHEDATLGEWDLITLEDNVVLERCIVRPFAAQRNTSMYLGRIHIGANSSIGLASIVAAGHSIPPNTCIGPNSSSWEMNDADESNRSVPPKSTSNAHWILWVFLGLPLQAVVKFIGSIPWLAALVALVRQEPYPAADMLMVVIRWFTSPNRVAFHYVALAAKVTFGPIFYYVAVLAIKTVFDVCLGKVQPGSAEQRTQMDKFRMQWLRTVMPIGQFHKLTKLFGTHYNMTSVLARGLGAKVGRRVYWPGTGPSIQDFDLLDIGDDVVFGSRSHLVTSDGLASDFVRIESGAMVADRVVLLPGVQVGKGTVMGSGALTRRMRRYPPGTRWVGSKACEAVCLSADCSTASPALSWEGTTPFGTSMISKENEARRCGSGSASSINSDGGFATKEYLNSEASSLSNFEKGVALPKSYPFTDLDLEKGRLHLKTDAKTWGDLSSAEPSLTETSSPFGRAFYQGKATYRVWGQFEIFTYSIVIAVATAVFWNVSSISAVQVMGRFSKIEKLLYVFLARRWWRPLSVYVSMVVLIAVIMAIQTVLVVAGTIAAKWILMGTRKPGNYDWDKSSYCQRWQLFLTLESFRRHCYGGQGILGLLTGTYWLVLYFRALGATIGKDCSLFSSGLPALMFTEPDLLTLGDRVSVDDASLVGHINTRGKFDLNPLFVGARSVLRSGSRLLSGAKMEEDSCLLEHTLVMAGDVVDTGSTLQGWPAESFRGSPMPTPEVARLCQERS